MRKFLFMVMVMAMLCVVAYAQEEAPEFDLGKVEAILAFGIGIGGLTVAALTEMLKRLVKAQGIAAYLCCAVVSALSTATYLLMYGGWNLIDQIIYTVAVFLTASGLYKMVKKPNP